MNAKVYKDVKLSAYKKLPRGIRNNNPLNIRRGKNPWAGEVKAIRLHRNEEVESDTLIFDKNFCQFREMALGFRAAARLLQKYQYTYKLNTIRAIISRWAPSNENNTEAYINAVAAKMNRDADEPLNLQKAVDISGLVWSMCAVECGMSYSPYKDEYMMDAWLEACHMLKVEGAL